MGVVEMKPKYVPGPCVGGTVSERRFYDEA